jgi:HK97 gp10 family phage protein
MTYKSYKRQVERALKQSKKNSLSTIGMFVEAEAKVRCPVKSGTLRGSISNKTFNGKVVVGTNTEYAPHVELGTSKQSAKPYLTPSVEENKTAIVNIVKEQYKKMRFD